MVLQLRHVHPFPARLRRLSKEPARPPYALLYWLHEGVTDRASVCSNKPRMSAPHDFSIQSIRLPYIRARQERHRALAVVRTLTSVQTLLFKPLQIHVRQLVARPHQQPPVPARPPHALLRWLLAAVTGRTAAHHTLQYESSRLHRTFAAMQMMTDTPPRPRVHQVFAGPRQHPQESARPSGAQLHWPLAAVRGHPSVQHEIIQTTPRLACQTPQDHPALSAKHASPPSTHSRESHPGYHPYISLPHVSTSIQKKLHNLHMPSFAGCTQRQLATFLLTTTVHTKNVTMKTTMHCERIMNHIAMEET
jgi:hypothetical protein